jgi:hypothetical protein
MYIPSWTIPRGATLICDDASSPAARGCSQPRAILWPRSLWPGSIPVQRLCERSLQEGDDGFHECGLPRTRRCISVTSEDWVADESLGIMALDWLPFRCRLQYNFALLRLCRHGYVTLGSTSLGGFGRAAFDSNWASAGPQMRICVSGFTVADLRSKRRRLLVPPQGRGYT